MPDYGGWLPRRDGHLPNVLALLINIGGTKVRPGYTTLDPCRIDPIPQKAILNRRRLEHQLGFELLLLNEVWQFVRIRFAAE